MSKTLVRTVSSPLALTTRDLAAAGAKGSSAATNRVPISTPSAPSVNAAASPRPSITPGAGSAVVAGFAALGDEDVGALTQRPLSLFDGLHLANRERARFLDARDASRVTPFWRSAA